MIKQGARHLLSYITCPQKGVFSTAFIPSTRFTFLAFPVSNWNWTILPSIFHRLPTVGSSIRIRWGRSELCRYVFQHASVWKIHRLPLANPSTPHRPASQKGLIHPANSGDLFTFVISFTILPTSALCPSCSELCIRSTFIIMIHRSMLSSCYERLLIREWSMTTKHSNP